MTGKKNMKANINSYIKAIENDNAQYIIAGNYASVADYIIDQAANSTGWGEYFDDDELADNPGQEPTDEQITDLRKYLCEVYNYLPDLATVMSDMVQAGAVYCSNGDAAHTFDNPDDCDAICDAMSTYGVREIEPGSGEYNTAAARLDLANDATARIFTVRDFIFSPDALRA